MLVSIFQMTTHVWWPMYTLSLCAISIYGIWKKYKNKRHGIITSNVSKVCIAVFFLVVPFITINSHVEKFDQRILDATWHLWAVAWRFGALAMHPRPFFHHLLWDNRHMLVAQTIHVCGDNNGVVHSSWAGSIEK